MTKAKAKAMPYPPILLVSIIGRFSMLKNDNTRNVVLTGNPQRVMNNSASGGSTNHHESSGKAFPFPNIAAYLPKVKSAAPSPPSHSPKPAYPRRSVTARMPPAYNHMPHHGTRSFEAMKVPRVWMLSLPTTE